METQTNHEQRMEGLALRQAAALEKLVNYALWWTLIPVLGLIIWGIWLFAA